MENLNISLKKVAKGTGLVFIGTILGTLLGLITRIITVRYITTTEFGLLSLALVIVNILAILSSLGFENSVPRYISYALGKKEYTKVWATIKTSLKVSLLLSIILSFTLFFLSPKIANLFHKSSLITPIRILAFTVPLMVLSNLLISILRGLEDVKGKIYFQNIFPFGIKIILLGFVILLGLSFRGVLYSYLISSLLTLVLIIHYAKKKISPFIPKTSASSPILAKELIAFSLPLLGTSIFTMIMGWTDTIMLGYFKSADVVGLYNVALPLSRFIALPLGALAFIYLPIASQLYAQGKLKEMKGLYATVTKWTFFVTLPVLLYMLLVPKSILSLLFGKKYIGASIALQLLVVGEFVHTFLGPNGMTMISLGRTNIILFCTLISALSNIILNLLLIPKYGLAGAAFASSISLLLANILRSVFLFKFVKIHPFKGSYLKLIIAMGFIMLLLLLLFQSNFIINLNIFILFFIIIFVIIILILFTKSIDNEDIIIIELLEKKMLRKNILSNKLSQWCKIK